MRLFDADPEAMALTDLGASRTFGELEHDVDRSGDAHFGADGDGHGDRGV